MATSWSCKSPFSSTANRRTERESLAAIHAKIPRNAERTPLDAHRHRIAGAKTIVVVKIHCQPFDLLSVAPGANDQPARPSSDPRHVVAAFHRSGVIGQAFF